MSYQYKPAACQVRDKKALEVYRFKRVDWLRLLNGDEAHSISHQLSAMLWNDAAYRIFNEARRFASQNNPRSAIAPILGEFLDAGYVATQVLAISKIVEKNPNDPNKGVISLTRVLDEIFSHRGIITREMYVAYDGLPYDYEPVKDAYYKDLFSSGKAGSVQWLANEGPQAWATSERVHHAFDKLSGVAVDRRSPDDLIAPEVFASLFKAMKDPVFDEIRLLRHKWIAHAADENNRPENVVAVSLNLVARAHKILSRVAHTIGGTILFEGGAGGMPTPQFDQLEFLDREFVANNDLEALYNFWDENATERDGWLQNADEMIFSDRAGD